MRFKMNKDMAKPGLSMETLKNQTLRRKAKEQGALKRPSFVPPINKLFVFSDGFNQKIISAKSLIRAKEELKKMFSNWKDWKQIK